MRVWNAAFRMAVLAGLWCAAGYTAPAQTALPATPPTAMPAPAADIASSADSASGAPMAAAPVRQAQVSYQMGQLTVIAENSSLDQILRDVGSKTGMKITGSVADQQVYGIYGPAAPAKVLGQLLEGSGANMILRENATSGPVELVLSPMQGLPSSNMPGTPVAQPSAYTPRPYTPQPYAPRPYAPQSSYQPQNLPAPSRPAYVTQPQPQSQYSAQPQPVSNLPAAGTVPGQSSEPESGVPQSPNGVRTPQQIFEQLQRLQQQRPQAPATAH